MPDLTAMADPSWTDVGAFILGAAGTVLASFSIAIAVRANRTARRSAIAAESAVQIEGDREHERFAPIMPEHIDAYLTQARTLRGSITVGRDYRVRGETVSTGASGSLDLPVLLRAGQEYEFQIEQWPPGRSEPQAEALRFRFWPPAEFDDVERWSCPCNRQTAEGTSASPAHWQRVVPIKFFDPTAVSVY
jgi:hypothetical protein